MEYIYEASIHENVIAKVFNNKTDVLPNEKKIKCVLMGFVNRSGSNYLGELLKSTGQFGGFEESLNDYSVENLSKSFGVESFEEYLIRLHREQVKNAGVVWGLKVGWGQLALLLRTKAVPNLLDSELVLVKRADIFAQAISMYIATKTAKWTSAVAAVKDKADIEYDGQAILMHYRSICNSYAMMEQIAGLSGIPSRTIIYEDLLDRTNTVVGNLCRDLVGRPLTPSISNVKISMQRDQIDQAFKTRFLKELNELKWVGIRR